MKKAIIILCSLLFVSMLAMADNVVLSPYLFKVVGPRVYRSEATRRAFSLDWTPQSEQKQTAPVETDGMRLRDGMNELMDIQLFKAYMEHPTDFQYHEGMVEGQQLIFTDGTVEQTGSRTGDKTMRDLLSVDSGKKDVASLVGPLDIGLEIERPNFWKTNGVFSLQYTQNYYSEMWYKGANNNMTFLGSVLLEANYNDQKRIQWDNKLEMRLGFINSKSDTVHKYIPSDNKLYLMSKLGVRAVKDFFYTLSTEAQTQIMNGYKVNDTTKYSAILAPLDVFVSIGMDYKPKLKHENTLSVAVLPLSYKLRYIAGGDDVIIKEYKMRDGLRHQNDFGSKIEANCKFTLVKNLVWKSRLYYYTTYKYVEAEWENVLTYSFSRYIQTEFFTLWRFDDNRDMKYWDEKLGFFQFREYLTLGLAYKF